MAVYQSRHQWLTLSHRGQAPSHSGTVLPVACCGTGPKSLSEISSIVRLHTAHNVGGGLPPMAVYQSRHQWLTLSHRGQAPSHL